MGAATKPLLGLAIGAATGGGGLAMMAGAGMGLSMQQAEDTQNLARDLSGQQIAAGREAAATADPFRAQRPMYQDLLKQLMTDPNFILDSPVYKAQQEAGMETVERSLGARGLLQSGGRLTALQDYGQGLASGLFFNYANLLSGLSGASANPAAAGSIMMQGTSSASNLSMLGQRGSQDLYSQALAQGMFGISQIKSNTDKPEYRYNPSGGDPLPRPNTGIMTYNLYGTGR